AEFPDLPIDFGTSIGTAHVTAYGANGYCGINGFGGSGTSLVVNVLCYGGSGAPADMSFDVLLTLPPIGPGILAFVKNESPSAPSSIPLNYQTFSSSGQPPRIDRTS